MSRRAGKSDPNEALELFLDAISNTFGGVLFIALLVIVLLSQTGVVIQDQTQDSPEQIVKLQSQLSLLDEEMKSIQTRLAMQEQQLEQLQKAADQDLLRRYLELKAEAEKADAEVDALSKQLAEINAKLDRIRQRQRQAQQKTRVAQTQLDQLRSGENVKVRLPQFRKTKKLEVAAMLAGGKLTFMARYANGKPLGPNDDDAMFGADRKTVKPRPGRGHVVNPSGDSPDVDTALKQFTKDKHYIAIAVWPDSYSHAATLRDRLVRMGFEYNFLLPKEGEPVTTDAGQGGVQ